MKFNKWILGLAAVAALTFATSARAQLGNDVLRAPVTAVMAAPQVLPVVNGVNTYTNGWVDLLGYTGIGRVDIVTVTNAGGTLTVGIEATSDTNSPALLQNYAFVNSTATLNITNLYYSTNYVVQDTFLLPYSVSSPTASTAGYATPYPVYNLFTNTAASQTVTAKGNYIVGVNLVDCPRYARTIWTATGAATNGSTVVSAVLTGYRTPAIVK